ncbi:Superoxide dismutase [Mn], mitochondrial, partial [Neolecta irregularis DAH-3]
MYTLPDLPYGYHDLEPYISGEIMRIHHQKHHQTYISNLNAAEQKYAVATENGDVAGQLALQAALKFNGGGHINHSIFWKTLAPAGQQAEGHLKEAIESEFGGMKAFIEKFNGALAGIQGSGWGWLVKGENGRLQITTTANQDPVIGPKVIIGVDAWEHAYYLQYQNVKADYFKAIWNVMNWKELEKRYSENIAA